MIEKDKSDVVKSNALINAFYQPSSVTQMRVLVACLLQIKAKEKIDWTRRFEITANALADLTGLAAKNNYRELKRAADDLSKMVIKINYGANKKAPKKGMTGKSIGVINEIDYFDNEGRVVLSFTPAVIPHIMGIKENFTQYQAKHIMPMRSGYGIRLYELCLQWLGEEREFSIEEFKLLFGIEKKYIGRIDELKAKVIKPALRDINAHSDIRVRFGQRKTGRRVTHFQFIITKPTEKAKPLTHRDWIARYSMAQTGESWEQALKRTVAVYQRYKAEPLSWVKANCTDNDYRQLLEKSGQKRLSV